MIIPTLRYKDSVKALSWLQEAFGLSQGMVTSADDGTVAHAEMFLGDGCVMFGAASQDSDWDVQPSSGAIYADVDDIDGHCQRAKAAGGEILYGPRDTDYGSREYAAKDFEGNSWSFGTYKPQKP